MTETMWQFHKGKKKLSHFQKNVAKEKILKITGRQHAYNPFDTLITTEHKGGKKHKHLCEAEGLSSHSTAPSNASDSTSKTGAWADPQCEEFTSLQLYQYHLIFSC